MATWQGLWRAKRANLELVDADRGVGKGVLFKLTCRVKSVGGATDHGPEVRTCQLTLCARYFNVAGPATFKHVGRQGFLEGLGQIHSPRSSRDVSLARGAVKADK